MWVHSSCRTGREYTILYIFIIIGDLANMAISCCTFQNTATITPPAKAGIGINAFDARFVVDELCTSGTIPCTSFQRSKFKNLNYGVIVQGRNAAEANAQICNSDFDYNFNVRENVFAS